MHDASGRDEVHANRMVITRKFSLNGLVDMPFHYITHPLDDSVILIH